MSEQGFVTRLTNNPTRRQVLCGFTIALGSLAAGPALGGKTQEQMKEMASSPVNKARTYLHQEIDLKASPQRIYDALVEAKQFAAFTGLPAEIEPKAGGGFSMFGGLIVGRNIELITNERVVQAWRPTHWDPGIYSIAKFELKPRGSGTLAEVRHGTAGLCDF